jgi:hypothetical protein
MNGVLRIAFVGEFSYRAADAHALARWLSRFPALVRLELHGQSVPVSKQPALVEAIVAGRTGVRAWEGAHFDG